MQIDKRIGFYAINPTEEPAPGVAKGHAGPPHRHPESQRPWRW